MEVRVHESVDEFRQIAEPLYRRDPVAHTIELTLLAAGGFPDDSFLMSVWDDGTDVGAALQTPPYPLACNGIPHAVIDSVAADLVVCDRTWKVCAAPATRRLRSRMRGKRSPGERQ